MDRLKGRITVLRRFAEHQREVCGSGEVEEAGLMWCAGKRFFNRVVEWDEAEAVASGAVIGADVGESAGGAHRLSEVFGGEHWRDWGILSCALGRPLRCDGSWGARRKGQVFGEEMRHRRSIHPKRARGVLPGWSRQVWARITVEGLMHIQDRITAEARACPAAPQGMTPVAELHRRQGEGCGIAVEAVDPAYPSRTCAHCGDIGKRAKHRFMCGHCRLWVHADLKASPNLARAGGTTGSAKGYREYP